MVTHPQPSSTNGTEGMESVGCSSQRGGLEAQRSCGAPSEAEEGGTRVLPPPHCPVTPASLAPWLSPVRVARTGNCLGTWKVDRAVQGFPIRLPAGPGTLARSTHALHIPWGSQQRQGWAWSWHCTMNARLLHTPGPAWLQPPPSPAGDELGSSGDTAKEWAVPGCADQDVLPRAHSQPDQRNPHGVCEQRGF